MSRVITFSTAFPIYHSRKGEPTRFVEKMWECLYLQHSGSSYFSKMYELGFDIGLTKIYEPKYHTIREGKRWKAGDYFSPRVWSGKPRHSKQIIIAPDTKIEKLWDIDIYPNEIFINNKLYAKRGSGLAYDIALNDGLDVSDFWAWFNKLPFSGQILCWSKDINY